MKPADMPVEDTIDEFMPPTRGKPPLPKAPRADNAPIEGQEVWAAGVTYYRSRGARMEESKDAGGGNFYDRVYSAERPELFFKSTASRTVGTGGKVRIRADAKWSVPEPTGCLTIRRSQLHPRKTQPRRSSG